MTEQERKLNIQIRPARPADAEFLAWLILTAGRAHVSVLSVLDEGELVGTDPVAAGILLKSQRSAQVRDE